VYVFFNRNGLDGHYGLDVQICGGGVGGSADNYFMVY